MKTPFNRLGVYAAFALALALVVIPNSAHAQFGALKKAKAAAEKAKAAKAKLDSVKSTVDDARSLISGSSDEDEASPVDIAVDEKTFGQFTAGYALEQASLPDKTPAEALQAATLVSQLSAGQYGALKTKVVGYALAKSKKGDMPELSTDERKVLDKNEKTILALVKVK